MSPLKPGSHWWDKHKHKHEAHAHTEMAWFMDDWFCACVCLVFVLALYISLLWTRLKDIILRLILLKVGLIWFVWLVCKGVWFSWRINCSWGEKFMSSEIEYQFLESGLKYHIGIWIFGSEMGSGFLCSRVAQCYPKFGWVPPRLKNQ